ncbi:hypothetical protein [Empedobacter brevis]|uniref:hypothetical protein n=1 Tax=Empedobacter brevis TaxID=247 RepID=UPI002899058A|nr:hypothetical protein [Empedobacter brevis]
MVIKLILFLILFSLLNSCIENKEIFIIPENFQGEVIVFYKTSTDYKDFDQSFNKITYNVPSSGIISVPFDVSKITSLEWRDSKGRHINFYNNEELSNQNINITDVRRGYIFLDSGQVKYLSFYVGKKDFINNFDTINPEEYIKNKYEHTAF